jgi:hypothetical protein
VSPAFTITVKAEAGHLWLAGPEKNFLPLEPEADTRFFFRPLYVTVSFESNAAGQVTHLNWGGDFPCKRLE